MIESIGRLRGHTASMARRFYRAEPSNRAAADSRSAFATLCSRLAFGAAGQAMAETALVLPILVFLMVGIWQYSMVFVQGLQLAHATDVGARYLQQLGSSHTTDPCQDVYNQIVSAAPTLAAHVTVSVTLNGITPTQTGNTCAGQQTDIVSGNPISISTSYPYSVNILGIIVQNGTLYGNATEFSY